MIRSLYFIKKHDNVAVDSQKLKNIHRSESDFSSSIDLSKESPDMKKEKNETKDRLEKLEKDIEEIKNLLIEISSLKK